MVVSESGIDARRAERAGDDDELYDYPQSLQSPARILHPSLSLPQSKLSSNTNAG